MDLFFLYLIGICVIEDGWFFVFVIDIVLVSDYFVLLKKSVVIILLKSGKIKKVF